MATFSFARSLRGWASVALLAVGLVVAQTVTAQTATCPFDDGNSSLAVEGVVLTRYALGITGAPLVANTGINAVDAPMVEAAINCPSCGLNITGNPTMTVADATIISRKLAGFSGPALTNGVALGSGTRNTVAAVNSFLLAGCGATGGTVTSVTAGTGLSGGPITASGALSLAATYRLPQSCGNGQVPKYNTATSLWECQHDNTGTSGGSGTVTSVATGAGLTGGPITGAGTIGLAASQLLPTTTCADSQTLIWNSSSSVWLCAAWGPPGANAFVNGGNAFGAPAIIGTTDAQSVTLKSGGDGVAVLATAGSGLRISEVNDVLEGFGFFSANVINGSGGNSVASRAIAATIAGGGAYRTIPLFDRLNRVNASYGTVSGGGGNTVVGRNGTVSGGLANTSEYSGTVSGGESNTAGATASVVGGGLSNTSSGYASTVSGGTLNNATGYASIVPGGARNMASGDFSFAAGQRAVAGGDRTFVWNSYNTPNNLQSRTDSFRVQAANGFDVNYGANKQYYFAMNADIPGFIVVTSTDVGLSTGGVWTNQSDRAKKREFAPINARDVLRKVVALPLSTWSYLAEEANIRHMGPMAQDFWKAFGLGYGDKTMNDVDSRGVAFAAIQGLNQKLTEQVKTKDGEIAALKARLQAIEKRLGL